MGAAALNMDQISPGDMLDTKSRPIPRFAKRVAVASGKPCGFGPHAAPELGSWINQIF
jgi:hypothetical protein